MSACRLCGVPIKPYYDICATCILEEMERQKQHNPMTNQPASDTPLTDEQACPFNDLPSEESDDEVVPADFARNLERTIARLSAEREELQREIDDSLTKWTKTRAAILEPAECGVPGHFKFQENGMKCSMCQKQRWLVQQHEAALAERDRQLAAMKTKLVIAETNSDEMQKAFHREADKLADSQRQKSELEGKAVSLCEDLIHMVEEYHSCKWDEEPFTPDFGDLDKRLQSLRQSTQRVVELSGSWENRGEEVTYYFETGVCNFMKELDIINRLYLELSQFTTAKTARELELESVLKAIKEEPHVDETTEMKMRLMAKEALEINNTNFKTP